MGTISCHSNQSSYPDGMKKHIFSFLLPIDAICGIWKESALRHQEMSFENVDGRTDGRRTDGRRMPVYTISSPTSLRLRYAKNITFVEGNVLCKYAKFQLHPPYDF